MNKLFLAGLITVAITSSCADKKPDHDNSIVPTEPQAQALIKDSVPVANTANITIPPSATTINANPASKAAQAVTSSPAPVTTAPGMNPPHGQPGHRCEIAVGAPLNSAPTNKTAQPSVTTTSSPVTASSPAIQTITPTATTTPTVTAPGMNPPHGQPGHDCTIAVGAPLKSKN